MKLFKQLMQIIKGYGVREVFAVPGDAINAFVDEFRKDDEVKFIHVSHEEAGAFAASCQAKLTGRLSVCAGTVGPGAIHLLNGLYDAQMDEAPVLAICGQVPTSERGSRYHQEVDLKKLFSDVAVFVEEVFDLSQMPRLALDACNAAMEKKGVAVLIVPHDIGGSDVEDTEIHIDIANTRSRLVPATDRLVDAVQRINNASKVAIFAGKGTRGVQEEVLSLAEHLKAPIIRSLKAKDIIPEDHPHFAGGIGLLGDRAGVEAMEKCDLLLMLGTDFPYREWISKDAEVIQVNQKLVDANRRVPRAFPIIGDCEVVVPYFLDNCNEKQGKDFLEDVCDSDKFWNYATRKFSQFTANKNTIHPQKASRILSEYAPDDTIYTCDTGAVTVWGGRYVKMKKGQRFTACFNLASMAYAMPASIGAQLAYPDRTVVSLSGDGGLNMLMGDLLTIVKYKLPIKVIVYNNGKLGLIKMEQEVDGYPEFQTDLHNPDYVKLADAVGMKGYRASSAEELESLLPDFYAEDGPAMLDMNVNPDELTLPPKISIDQTVGFSLSKLKEMLQD